MAAADDRRLIREARAGSPDALNAIFHLYGERLLALIRLRLGPSLRRQLESRDVLQETLLKAFEHLDQFDGSGERSLMGWLGGIAQNEILDQAKFFQRERRDVRRNVSIEKAQRKASEQLRTEISRIHLRSRSRQLEQALEALSKDHREVILLRSYEELSFPEIAKRLGRSAAACRQLHVRALAALTLEMERIRS